MVTTDGDDNDNDAAAIAVKEANDGKKGGKRAKKSKKTGKNMYLKVFPLLFTVLTPKPPSARRH